MNNSLLTSEVAKKFNVSERVARGWCERGKFPNAYKEETPFGAYWRIPESDLIGFEPQKGRGRPKSANPSKAALAKRRQREQETKNN